MYLLSEVSLLLRRGNALENQQNQKWAARDEGTMINHNFQPTTRPKWTRHGARYEVWGRGTRGSLRTEAGQRWKLGGQKKSPNVFLKSLEEVFHQQLCSLDSSHEPEPQTSIWLFIIFQKHTRNPHPELRNMCMLMSGFPCQINVPLSSHLWDFVIKIIQSVGLS